MFSRMNEDFSVDIKRLISEVRKRPILYDNSAPNYYKCSARDEKWEEIFKTLVPNWDTIVLIEQQNLGLIIKKKWRSIRDSFIKDYRRRINSKDQIKSRRYIFSNQLKFIIPSLQKPKGNEIASTNPPFSEDDDDSVDSQHSEKSPNTSRATKEVEDDEDKLFLESLLPLYKTMSEDLKLMSRCKIFETLRTVIQGDASYSSSVINQQLNVKPPSDLDVPTTLDEVKSEPSSPTCEIYPDDEDPLSMLNDSPTPKKKPRFTITANRNISNTLTVSSSSSSTTAGVTSSSAVTNNTEDIFEAIGKNVAHKLRSMVQQQRIIAEKIVGDVMYHGQMESLTVDSHLTLSRSNSELE